MEQKIIKIGNSAGIILPYKLQKQVGVQLGDSVKLEMQDPSSVVISPIKKKHDTREVDPKFMKMVDEFINEHQDVLKELANR